MQKLRFFLIISAMLVMITGCQTVKEKTDAIVEKENEKLSEYIGKSASKLQMELGKPDEDFKNASTAEKLEWVIVDDGKETMQDLLPHDKRIKYYKLQTPIRMDLGKKRNYCVEKCSHKIILALLLKIDLYNSP